MIARASAWAVPAAVLGGAACVSCTALLFASIASAMGVGVALPLVGLPLWGLALAGGALTVGAGAAVVALRRNEAACAVPPPRSPYLIFRPRTAALAILLAGAAVVGTALAAKAVVEGAGLAAYTIHWTTTVPALVAAFAWIFNGQLNGRVRS